MNYYIEATNCLSYNNVRESATVAGRGDLSYIAGLLRLGNLLIESQLKKNTLDSRLRLTLDNNEDLDLRLKWGSKG